MFMPNGNEINGQFCIKHLVVCSLYENMRIDILEYILGSSPNISPFDMFQYIFKRAHKSWFDWYACLILCLYDAESCLLNMQYPNDLTVILDITTSNWTKKLYYDKLIYTDPPYIWREY